MKIKDVKDNSDFYSGKVSDLTRQLAFAGLAVVWLFKVDKGGVPKVSDALLLPSTLIVLGLLCDFAQYVYGALAWERYRDAREHEVGPDDVFFPPKRLIVPTDLMFRAKIALIAAAYVLLTGYLVYQIF